MVLKVYNGTLGVGRVLLQSPSEVHPGLAAGGFTHDANRSQGALSDARTKCEPLCQFCVS
jgi:hypothetical protein